ncbi:hypothetical protein U0070_021869, partial [Myodes glareolus]
EGASIVISFTYVNSVSSYFPLYKQGPGKHLKLITDICSIMRKKVESKTRMSNGNSATQTEGLVTVTEGFPIKMNCTYQTTNLLPFLSWYVQYLNKVPQLLLRSATDNKRTEHQGFHATLHKSNSSFHLQKSSVQLSDSARYYCALRVNGQQVKQSPVSLVLQEGERAELQCNFSTSVSQVQWFYQSPGGHLISLFYNPSGTKQSGRLKSTTVTQERRSSLYISSTQTTDSGTYFCAMDPQCFPHTCS